MPTLYVLHENQWKNVSLFGGIKTFTELVVHVITGGGQLNFIGLTRIYK